MIKWISGFLGFSYYGIVGALIGYFIGSAIDRSLSLGVGAVNPFTADQRRESFLKTSFTLMGTLAKADGHVSKLEIAQVEGFMNQMGMTAEHRQQAINYFKEGTSPDCDVNAVLKEFRTHCGHTRNLNQVLLSYLIAVALADGVMHHAEEAVLQRIASALGFTSQEFLQLLSMINAQDHFSGSAASSEATVSEAYKALGVESTATDKEVKKAYRQLMSKYHPDKLMGQGVPEDMIQSAKERSQEIVSAYDLIKKNRANG